MAYNMSEWRSFVSILKGSGFDILVLLVTFFLTVLVDLTYAIQVGVVLSSAAVYETYGRLGQKMPPPKSTAMCSKIIRRCPKVWESTKLAARSFLHRPKQYCSTLKMIGSKSRVLTYPHAPRSVYRRHRNPQPKNRDPRTKKRTYHGSTFGCSIGSAKRIAKA